MQKTILKLAGILEKQAYAQNTLNISIPRFANNEKHSNGLKRIITSWRSFLWFSLLKRFVSFTTYTFSCDATKSEFHITISQKNDKLTSTI